MSRTRIIIISLWLGSLTVFGAPDATAESGRVLKRGRSHLRSGNDAEWDEFKNRTPEGRQLELHFSGSPNPGQQTLFIEQDDVKLDWSVRLNGTNLGKLFLMEAPLVWTIPIPTRVLRNGDNVLSITPPKENDDIIVGPITLDPRPASEALSEASLDVTVHENGVPVPCRITITRTDGVLAALTAHPSHGLAVRPGVIYTGDGHAQAQLLPGKYVIYASRGLEYSLAKKQIKLRSGEQAVLSLAITREVPTPGLASCDTHVHTWTYSRHGDATLDERMLTLAGEALELPVATDHNLVVDFSGCARSNGVAQYFTAIPGDEVTTGKGHFNAFPIRAGSPAPDFKIEPWPALMEAIRATPNVQVVVLNHPTDTHNGFCPFASTNFNRVTGENLRGFDFSFDCIELVNSGALRTDLMETFRDWFALLNYGYKVTGVGASDSHDVSRFIVGQGRTYIQCDDRNPGQIDVDQACRSLRAGKALISLGLLVQMRVDQKFGAGDLATGLGPQISIDVDVLGPSWAGADRVELFANGIKIREKRFRSAKKIQKARVSWTIPRPLHDVHLVAVATGPGVTSPHWATPRPYQPSSTKWTPRILGATNPIWLDADGDGRFTAARQYAQQLVDRVGTSPESLIAALANFDEAVAAQTASLCQKSGKDIRDPDFWNALRRAPSSVQSGFAAYSATLPGPNSPPDGH